MHMTDYRYRWGYRCFYNILPLLRFMRGDTLRHGV